jgi:4-alpha-glucanotransferase
MAAPGQGRGALSPPRQRRAARGLRALPAAEQADWLDDYALFMALCEAAAGSDWCDWDPPGAARAAALAAARAQHADRIAFWQFCQWRFFRQWRR